MSSATCLLFTAVPAQCIVLRVQCSWPLGSCSPVCQLDVLYCVCGVLGHLAPFHRCARSVRCVVCAVSWATWRLFTGVPAQSVLLGVRCPGPLGYCSPVCLLGVLCCICGVLGPLAPFHRCARSVRCVACALSLATWLLSTGVLDRSVALRLQCPRPLGSYSPVCPLKVFCWVCGVLGHLAIVHQCACSVCCVKCAVFWTTWLLFTGVPARCVVLRVRSSGPLGSCSPVCSLSALRCVCRVFGHLASVHRCAPSVRCVACAVSLAPCLLFTGVPAQCVVLPVRCPGPLGSCSPVCSLVTLCCGCGVLGHWAPFHRCARWVHCVACAVSRATWLLFSAVLAGCVVFLGRLPRVHRCARSVWCSGYAVSWATCLLFTRVPAQCVVLRMQCPWPLASCSPVCQLNVLCCVCGLPGHLALVLWCAGTVRFVACAVSWATCLLFTGVPARYVVLRVRCPWPLASWSPVCQLNVLCCLCGALDHLAPVLRSAGSARCVACAVSPATWFLFTCVLARCAVLHLRRPRPFGSCSLVCPLEVFVLGVRCPGQLGSCSPLCPLGVLCWLCGVLGH